MIQRLAKVIQRYRKIDRAILILRVFIAIVLIVNVWDKLFSDITVAQLYPPIILGSPIISFSIMIIIEVLCALFIAMGLLCSFASFILLLGVIVDLTILYPVVGWFGIKAQVLCGAVYLFFIISGGGKYSLDYYFTERSEEV